MIKKTFGVLIAICAVVSTVIVVSPVVFYLFGLRLIPIQARTIPSQVLPPKAMTVFWASLGGTGELRIERNNPYTLIWRIWKYAGYSIRPENRVTMLGARALLRNVPQLRGFQWQLAYASAGIWVGQHWTAEQAISAYLSKANFGNNFFGLDAAAQGYFGLSSANLSLEQMARLVVAANSSTILNPWSRPDENQAAARWVVSRLPP